MRGLSGGRGVAGKVHACGVDEAAVVEGYFDGLPGAVLAEHLPEMLR